VNFDAATAVRPTSGGGYLAELDPQWSIGGRPHGGYLLAVLGRAAGSALAAAGAEHPHPWAGSAHYVSSPAAGPAEIETELLRVGRSASQLRARLSQGGRTRVEALFTMGRLEPSDQPWWVDEPAVELPPLAECVHLPAPGPGIGVELAIHQVVDQWLDPACLGFASGRPTGRPEMRGWLGFADGRAPDPLGLLMALDGLPPATLELGTTGWVPTLELTCYIRALPQPGPLRVRQRARLVQSGYVDEVCDIWDSSGRLVGQASQLAGVRLSGPPAGQA